MSLGTLPGTFLHAKGTFGINFWMNNWGIRLQGSTHFGLVAGFSSQNVSYLQAVGGVVYRFNTRDKSYNSSNKKMHKWATKKPKKYKDPRSK